MEDHQDFFLKHKPKAYQQKKKKKTSYVQETNLSEAYYQRNNYYVQETNLRCWNALKGTKKEKQMKGSVTFKHAPNWGLALW